MQPIASALREVCLQTNTPGRQSNLMFPRSLWLWAFYIDPLALVIGCSRVEDGHLLDLRMAQS